MQQSFSSSRSRGFFFKWNNSTILFYSRKFLTMRKNELNLIANRDATTQFLCQYNMRKTHKHSRWGELMLVFLTLFYFFNKQRTMWQFLAPTRETYNVYQLKICTILLSFFFLIFLQISLVITSAKFSKKYYYLILSTFIFFFKFTFLTNFLYFSLFPFYYFLCVVCAPL